MDDDRWTASCRSPILPQNCAYLTPLQLRETLQDIWRKKYSKLNCTKLSFLCLSPRLKLIINYWLKIILPNFINYFSITVNKILKGWSKNNVKKNQRNPLQIFFNLIYLLTNSSPFRNYKCFSGYFFFFFLALWGKRDLNQEHRITLSRALLTEPSTHTSNCINWTFILDYIIMMNNHTFYFGLVQALSFFSEIDCNFVRACAETADAFIHCYWR